jgi:hypothetical protein
LQADMFCAINKIFFKKKDEVHRGSIIRLTKSGQSPLLFFKRSGRFLK